METLKLAHYFESQLDSLSLQPKSKTSILLLLKSFHLKVIKKFSQASLVSRSLSSAISKMTAKASSSIEENIRKKKLKAAILAKKELEDKLLFVSQSIGNLKETKAKKTQQELFEEEKQKAVDFALQVKKFSQMRKETESFLKAQTEKLKRKARVLEESDLILAEKMKERREITRLQELEKMREKREKREKDLEMIKLSKSFLPSGLEKKPLYLKIQENFKKTVEMPELEKRKNELKKKSAFFKSYQGESLKDHLKWYSSFKEQSLKAKESRSLLSQSQNRSLSVNPGYWAMKVIEEERTREEEKNLKLEEKKKMLERKVKYCELLKELHPPAVNPLKNSFSTEKSKEKTPKNRVLGSASVDSKKWKPHKFEPNHMVPPPKPRREPKALSYLEDRRKERQELSASPLNTKRVKDQLEKDTNETNEQVEFEKLHKNAKILEKIARKKEILMETKPLSVNTIQQAASVDKLLVSSIKAKLKVLENI